MSFYAAASSFFLSNPYLPASLAALLTIGLWWYAWRIWPRSKRISLGVIFASLPSLLACALFLIYFILLDSPRKADAAIGWPSLLT